MSNTESSSVKEILYLIVIQQLLGGDVTSVRLLFCLNLTLKNKNAGQSVLLPVTDTHQGLTK